LRSTSARQCPFRRAGVDRVLRQLPVVDTALGAGPAVVLTGDPDDLG
jgi:hypothetical protein